MKSETVPQMQAGAAAYYMAKGYNAENGTLAVPRMETHSVVAERLGITPGKPLTSGELAQLLDGKRADGEKIPGKAPTKISYFEFVFNGPKSFDVALIYANPAEREKLEAAYTKAENKLIDLIESEIGTASVGRTAGNRARNREPAHLLTVPIEHYTARPTYQLAKDGDTQFYPIMVAGDPKRHSHILVMNAAFTEEGRVTSLHQEAMDQKVHEWGNLGQAFLSTELQKLGVNVELDKRVGKSFNERMLRLTDIPDFMCGLHSKRHADGENAAHSYATAHGFDFDTLTPEGKASMMDTAILKVREQKANLNEYESWMQQGEDAGYKHRSVLRPGQERELRPAAERHKIAFDVALPLVDEQFQKRAVLEGSVPRNAAAKGFIEAGIESADEVNAVTAAMRSEGVIQNGRKTELHWDMGKDRFARVTTQLSIEMEEEAIGLLRTAAADVSVALSHDAIARAVARVSKRDGLDFTTEHGLKQRAFIDKIASQGRAAVGVGVAGSGKAQPDTAMVLTPTGFRPMGSLTIGNLVLCPDGRTAAVTGIFPQGMKEIFRVTFEDGRSTECCGDHLWKVWRQCTFYVLGRGRNGSKPARFVWLTKPLSEIKTWLETGSRRAERTAVPLIAPLSVDFPPKDLPIPPYALGALLGDGHFGLNSVHLSTSDVDVLNRVMFDLPEYVAKVSGIQDYRLSLKLRSSHTRGKIRRVVSGTIGDLPTVGGRNERLLTYGGEVKKLAEWANLCGLPRVLVFDRLVKSGWTVGQALGLESKPVVKRTYSPLALALDKLGLTGSRSHNKFIPTCYKNGSLPQRLAIIQGLMDTDGSVGNGTHGSITSTSHQLAKDIQEISWSLGARASITPRQTYCHNGRDGKVAGRPCWRVSIVHPDIKQFFSLPRKLSEVRVKEMRHDRLRIVKIEPVGTKPARCIIIDHPDHLYITDDYIVTHNSTALKPLIEAWHEAGRTSYGVTLAWRQTQGLRDAGVGRVRRAGKRKWEANTDTLVEAGVDAEKAMALHPFLKRVTEGKIQLDAKSTVIIDEIALVGTKQMLDLARLQAKHGFHLVGIGDDKQCQSIDAGATIDLSRRAFGADNVPELLSSTRQLTERDRVTASLWREGRAGEALARKDQDGTLKIVPGGHAEAVKATADLWWERKQANAGVAGYSLGISVPTNADGRAVGSAIRDLRRRAGQIGPDLLQLDACDQNGEAYSLRIARGDKVRLFDRVRGRNADGRYSIAGNNGTVVEVLSADYAGMTVRKGSDKVATIAWDALRKDGGPVRLSYGDAVTIDARQSDTVTEHITSMPNGSSGVNGFKAYTAESRHRVAAWLVTSQGAEKQEIQQRRPLGDPRNQETDTAKIKDAVLANMARNLSNQDKKTLAVDFMDQARNLRSGRVDSQEASWHRPAMEELQLAAFIAPSEPRIVETPVVEPPAVVEMPELPSWATMPATAEPAVVATAAEAVLADAIVVGALSYERAEERLMDYWEQDNPEPDADTRRDIWMNTGIDPIEQWEKRRMEAGMEIQYRLDVLIEERDKNNGADVDNAAHLPTVTQAARDNARASSNAPMIDDSVMQQYQQQRNMDRGMER